MRHPFHPYRFGSWHRWTARISPAGVLIVVGLPAVPRAGDIKLDPAAKPIALENTIAVGDGKGQTMQAIYKLEGRELWV